MAEGIELARKDAPEHARIVESLKEQLLIVFMKRLGGEVSITVEEVDDTSQDLLVMSVIDSVFHFKIVKKQ